jgi:hypothetical protein
VSVDKQKKTASAFAVSTVTLRERPQMQAYPRRASEEVSIAVKPANQLTPCDSREPAFLCPEPC